MNVSINVYNEVWTLQNKWRIIELNHDNDISIDDYDIINIDKNFTKNEDYITRNTRGMLTLLKMLIKLWKIMFMIVILCKIKNHGLVVTLHCWQIFYESTMVINFVLAASEIFNLMKYLKNVKYYIKNHDYCEIILPKKLKKYIRIPMIMSKYQQICKNVFPGLGLCINQSLMTLRQ